MNALPKKPGIIDPSTLTAAQKKALFLAARPGCRLFRRAGFWGRYPERVTLATATELCSIGLLRIDRTGREFELVITGAGGQTLAVLEQRQARRQG
jgi:hypothetical protein